MYLRPAFARRHACDDLSAVTDGLQCETGGFASELHAQQNQRNDQDGADQERECERHGRPVQMTRRPL